MNTYAGGAPRASGDAGSESRRVRVRERAAGARKLRTEPLARELHVAPGFCGARAVADILGVPVVAQRLERATGRVEEARAERGAAGIVGEQAVEGRVVTDLLVGRVGRARIEQRDLDRGDCAACGAAQRGADPFADRLP